MKGEPVGPEQLRQCVGKVRSRVGGCVVGSHALMRDENLHTDLAAASWLEVYLLGITGRHFSREALRLLDTMWAYTSYPDARIWNNRVAALAGSTRSTANLGVSAALAVSEGNIFGRGIDVRAIDFLARTRLELDRGGDLETCVRRELAERRSLAGYGRPVVNRRDERLEPILKLARSLGLGDGPHVRLAHDIERFLIGERLRMAMNYGAIAAALAADLGLSTREYYLYGFASFLAGMPPCYIDAAERPAGTFLPLPCESVAYAGVAKRAWRRL